VYLRFFTVKRLNTSKRETAHLPLISFRKTLWNTPEIKCAFRQVKNLHEPRGSFTLLCFSGFSSCMIKPLSGIQHCWRFIYLYTEYLNFIEKWSTRVIMRHQPIRRFSRNIPELTVLSKIRAKNWRLERQQFHAATSFSFYIAKLELPWIPLLDNYLLLNILITWKVIDE